MNDNITELVKDVIEKAEKATKLPWRQGLLDSDVVYPEDGKSLVAIMGGMGATSRKWNNAAYIVAACNAAPELARQVLELQEQLDNAITAHDVLKGYADWARTEIAQLRQALDAVVNWQQDDFKDNVALRAVMHEVKKALGL